MGVIVCVEPMRVSGHGLMGRILVYLVLKPLFNFIKD